MNFTLKEDPELQQRIDYFLNLLARLVAVIEKVEARLFP